MRRASRTTSSRAFSSNSWRDMNPAAAKPARNTITSTRLNLSLSPIRPLLPRLNDFIHGLRQLRPDNSVMSSAKVLFGFHAVGVRLKTAPASITEIYVEPARKDARMRQFLAKAQESGARVIDADSLSTAKLA